MFIKISQILNSCKQYGFLVGFLLITTAFVPISTLGFELPKMAALALTALIGSVVLFRAEASWLERLLGSLPGKLVLLFACTVLLSPLWSIAPWISIVGASPRFQGVLTILCALTVGMLVMHWVREEEGRQHLLLAIGTSNAVAVLYGVLQMLHIDPLAHLFDTEAFLGRTFSFLGHPNSLGQFIVLSLPFVVLASLRSKRQASTLFWAALALFNGVVLVGTVSRSALLGGACMLLFLLPTLRTWFRGYIQGVSKMQAVVLSLLAILTVCIGLLFFADRFGQAFEQGRSVAAREVIWDATFTLIEKRPTGYGLETMAFTSPQVTGKDLYKFEALTTTVDRAHAEVLDVLYALGPVGFISYVSLLILLILCSIRYRDHDRSGLLRAAALGIVGFAVAGLFGFPSVATLTLFWICVGTVLGLIPVSKVRVPSAVTALATCVLIVCSLIALVVSLQWMQARSLQARARVHIKEHPQQAIDLSLQSVQRFAQDRGMLIEAAELHLQTLETVEQQHEVLIERTQKLTALLQDLTGGRDGMGYLLQAWLSAVESDRTQMEAALEKAKTFLPTSITYHRTAAHLYTLLEDPEAASAEVEALRSLLPEGYFQQDSEIRRILQKQHPWLTKMEI